MGTSNYRRAVSRTCRKREAQRSLRHPGGVAEGLVAAVFLGAGLFSLRSRTSALLNSLTSGLGLARLTVRPRPRTEAGVWLGLAVVPGADGAEPRDLNRDLDLDFVADLPGFVSRILLLSLRGEVTALSFSTLNVFLSFLSRSLFGFILRRGILARDLVTLEAAGVSVLA